MGGFPSCDWIKFQKQGGMLEDHEGGHGVDGSFGNLDSDRGEFSFMNYLSELEMQQLQTPSLASNDDLGLEQSDPSGVEQLDLQSQSLESDAVIARELACLDPRREIASHSPVDVSMAVQVASQSLGVSSTKPHLGNWCVVSDFWVCNFITYRFFTGCFQTSFLECQS